MTPRFVWLVLVLQGSATILPGTPDAWRTMELLPFDVLGEPIYHEKPGDSAAGGPS